ncbi:chloride channel protein [Sandaracinus amylolyticus]|uniref:chloride channel protein n=1 Tax=Sandaracinus amylolyticus TaxID=927083 RepID=UPI003AF3A937
MALPRPTALVDRRVAAITALSVVLALVAAVIAQALQALIALITNLAFHQRVSLDPSSPADHALGAWVIVVPIVGGVIVGLMARYGSRAIRGHGIPEAMEQVLANESRIPLRMTFLKPLSAAIAIGTGGPFGAEGPIIATGGALGSVLGQLVRVTPDERKTLLAAGAAAGMTATFGTPVSAVLLAIELLLFEYRARSVIPVAIATSTAAAARIALVGAAPVFAMHDVAAPGAEALCAYVLLGALLGLASVAITRALYAIEDGFERLPVHWMWWPAIGAVAVGAIGWLAPRTLGVGYENIEQMLDGELAGRALVVLCIAKLVSWSISLGSGTSGGTLAPLFTIGGAMGALLASIASSALPGAAIDPRVGALVGMAAMFAGASRALLASAVFAFETTQQPMVLLPLIGGCAAAYFVSCLAMPNSIMTEKLARRGLRVPAEYAADVLARVLVRERMSTSVVTLAAERALADVRAWLATGSADAQHQGFPVIDAGGELIGVVTRRDLVGGECSEDATIGSLVHRTPIVVTPDRTLRDVADDMIEHDVGRVVVVERARPRHVVGILTRGDLLRAYELRIAAERHAHVARPLRARS